ncbi:hypothetical protein [Streptomyces sp. NPDC007905]|uniref:hypothetical protein n=1 Tax=Streptomyces sp. NPDC007905 TaxID=3364788 RepID=UPI0036E3FABD
MDDRPRSGTRRTAGPGTDLALLGICLNDHLAGATAGTERARHLVRSTHDAALGPVSAEIAQDRTALLGIMRKLGVPVRRYKVCAAWTAEKVARLKGNGRLVRRSPLSTVLDVVEEWCVRQAGTVLHEGLNRVWAPGECAPSRYSPVGA